MVQAPGELPACRAAATHTYSAGGGAGLAGGRKAKALRSERRTRNDGDKAC